MRDPRGATRTAVQHPNETETTMPGHANPDTHPRDRREPVADILLVAEMAFDNAERFTCTEAAAMARLLVWAGAGHRVPWFLTEHGIGDDDGDDHGTLDGVVRACAEIGVEVPPRVVADIESRLRRTT